VICNSILPSSIFWYDKTSFNVSDIVVAAWSIHDITNFVSSSISSSLLFVVSIPKLIDSNPNLMVFKGTRTSWKTYLKKCLCAALASSFLDISAK